MATTEPTGVRTVELPVDELPSAPVPPLPPVPAAPVRRVHNPFLQVDPDQRAQRLARALISDLVVYHPQKRQEGIQFGTLPQLFREDIAKSYAEYVEQVGQELADRTPYFQGALNDLLAGGTPVF
ncbi:MAG: hypothetical protein WCK74_12500 [Gemmatimonadaceae bacterium]